MAWWKETNYTKYLLWEHNVNNEHDVISDTSLINHNLINIYKIEKNDVETLNKLKPKKSIGLNKFPPYKASRIPQQTSSANL